MIKTSLAALFAPLLAASLLAGCVPQEPPVTAAAPPPPQITCSRPSQAATELQFYLGRKTGDGGRISGSQLNDFMNEVVTPTFPDGLSAWDAEGRGSDYVVGKTYDEGTKVLVLFVFDTTNLDQRIQTVADAYKTLAKQRSVLVIQRPTCYAFR